MVNFAEELWDGLPALNEHARETAKATKDFMAFLKGVSAAEEQYIKTVNKLARKHESWTDEFLGTTTGSSMAGVMDRFLAGANIRARMVQRLNDQVTGAIEESRDLYTRGGKKLHSEGQALEEKLQLARAARESAKQKYEKAARLVDLTRTDTYDTPVSELLATPVSRLQGMHNRLVRVAKERDTARDHYRSAVVNVQNARRVRDEGMNVVLRTLQSHESQRADSVKAALVRLSTILSDTSNALHDIHKSIQPIADAVSPAQDVDIIASRLTSGKMPVPEETYQHREPQGSCSMAYRSFLAQFRVRAVPAVAAASPPRGGGSGTDGALSRDPSSNSLEGRAIGQPEPLMRKRESAPPNTLYGVDQSSGEYREAVGKVRNGLDTVFKGQTLPLPEGIAFSELLQTAPARAAFIRDLNQRRQRPRMSTQDSFRALCTWTRCAVASAVQQEDFASVRNLLNMSGTFYTESERTSSEIQDDDDDYVFVTEEQLARYYVQDELREDPIWRDVSLWESILNDALCYRGELGGGDSVQGEGMGVDSGDDATLAYSQLVALSWSMSEFGLPAGDVQAFVDKQCLEKGVDPVAKDLLTAQIQSLSFVDEPARPEGVEAHVSPAHVSKGTPTGSPSVKSKPGEPGTTENLASSQQQPVDTASFEERLILAKKLKDFGNELFQDRQYYEAIQQYLQALNLILEMQYETPQLADRLNVITQSCHLNIAASALQMKDYHLTIEFCRKAMAIDQTNIKARFRLGLAYARLGKIVLALRQIRTVVQYVPDDQQAMSELTRMQELFRLCRLLLMLGER